MSRPEAACQLRLRFMLGEEIALGPGKVDLLDAVDRLGSISQAARQLGMSYARAWRLINTMNQCFAAPLVETSKGGEKGGGASVTALGREVIRRYRRIEADMLRTSAGDLAELQALIRPAGN